MCSTRTNGLSWSKLSTLPDLIHSAQRAFDGRMEVVTEGSLGVGFEAILLVTLVVGQGASRQLADVACHIIGSFVSVFSQVEVVV